MPSPSNAGELRGVTASIEGSLPGERFHGAAVLRTRPHPLSGVPALQLGVPDDVLGFRPRLGASYTIAVDGEPTSYVSHAVWLERVQSSWWFVLARE